MKRALSTAGSPPPSAPSKPAKKPRPARPRKPKAKKGGGDPDTPAGSPPASGAESPFPGASSPPAAARGDSPAVFGGARGRSASVAVEGGGSKGKERAVEAEGLPAPDGGGAGAAAGPEAEEQDAEDEVFEFSDDEFGSNQREAAKQKEDLRVLLEHFDEEQMDRYEAYRRSGLAKGSVRKLVNQVLAQNVSPSILTVVRGFAKVFVGEIVEKARAQATHPGALTPQDLREAYRVYLEEHEGAGAGGATQRKKLFVR
ncbi:uncharacterized protein JCM10292_001460 [Rhodotorula paludigena]|uniref:uncharacterized protein n=1 Tax=Rhodotorula paludigena TaxID=86838 RepID=UPI003178D437